MLNNISVNVSRLYTVKNHKTGEMEEIECSMQTAEQVLQKSNDPTSFESAALARTTIIPVHCLVDVGSLKVEAHEYDEANRTKSVQRSAAVVGLMPTGTVARIKADLLRRERIAQKKK